eukprot:4852570-Prymnesium_polylepis.1
MPAIRARLGASATSYTPLLHSSYALLIRVSDRFGLAGLPYAVLSGGVLTGKYHETSDASAEAVRASRLCRQPNFQPRYG